MENAMNAWNIIGFISVIRPIACGKAGIKILLCLSAMSDISYTLKKVRPGFYSVAPQSAPLTY